MELGLKFGLGLGIELGLHNKCVVYLFPFQPFVNNNKRTSTLSTNLFLPHPDQADTIHLPPILTGRY